MAQGLARRIPKRSIFPSGAGSKLRGTRLPPEASESVNAATAARIEEAMAEYFVADFRLIMVVGVGLALPSALVALVISRQHPTPTEALVLSPCSCSPK